MKSIVILFIVGFVSGVIASLLHVKYAGSLLQNAFFFITFVANMLFFILVVKKIYEKFS
jgi:putative effector of murein hydrolase LrgA (UPF0299 family)